MHDKTDSRERQSTPDKASMIHTGHASVGHPKQYSLPQDLITTQHPFWAQKPYKLADMYAVCLHLESICVVHVQAELNTLGTHRTQPGC